MSEEQAIRAVIHLYVDGMAFANEPALKKAFHSQAAIIGNYQGTVEWMSRDEFIAAILAETPAAPGSQPLMEIEMIEITGDAASVRVVDEFGDMRFSDYLSLLKIDGRWTIVNKLYHLHASKAGETIASF
jgi:Putative lumazine-binding